jgi:hypothetical protein
VELLLKSQTRELRLELYSLVRHGLNNPV